MCSVCLLSVGLVTAHMGKLIFQQIFIEQSAHMTEKCQESVEGGVTERVRGEGENSEIKNRNVVRQLRDSR